MDYGQKTASQSAEQIPELAAISNRLSPTNDSFSMLLERMEKSLNRIAGTHPAEVLKGSVEPKAACHIGGIRMEIDRLDEKCARFNSLVERLESIG